jgi:hypothetical protein
MKRVIANGQEPLRFDPASENDKRTQLEHVIIVFARVMAIILLIQKLVLIILLELLKIRYI